MVAQRRETGGSPCPTAGPGGIIVAAGVLAVLAVLALHLAHAAPIPFLLLYQRITPGKAARHLHRAAILDLVQQHPGLPLAKVAASISVSYKTAAHHARVLQHCRLLEVHRAGRSVVLFPVGLVNLKDRRPLADLQRPAVAAMLRRVMEHPGLTVTQLAALQGKTKSTTSERLAVLRRHGLVEVDDARGYHATPFAFDAQRRLGAPVKPVSAEPADLMTAPPPVPVSRIPLPV